MRSRFVSQPSPVLVFLFKPNKDQAVGAWGGASRTRVGASFPLENAAVALNDGDQRSRVGASLVGKALDLEDERLRLSDRYIQAPKNPEGNQRARQDSNLRPTAPEAVALSS